MMFSKCSNFVNLGVPLMSVADIQPRAPKEPLTAAQVFEIYNVKISPQMLGAMRRRSRLNAGPPFRYAVHYPPPLLTGEEEAVMLAQAEYEDDTGILGRGDDEEGCIRLAAQTLEDAKAEAEWLWQTEPHEGAIGYSICSRDWSSKHVFYLPLDNVVMLGNVRTRKA